MKLTSFRIRNFRSIKDTGWHDLAFDNITCLIGQNESGKTSVLEGLKAFHDGQLIEDMLRSDLSLPIVTCRFSFNFDTVKDSINTRRIHPDVVEKLQELDQISLIREWESLMNSHLKIGEELKDIFQAEEDLSRARETRVNELLTELNSEYKKAQIARDKAEDSLKGVEALIEKELESTQDSKKSSRNLFGRVKKESLSQKGKESINKLEAERNEKKASLEDKSKKLEEFREKNQLSDQIAKKVDDIEKKRKELAEARERYLHVTQMLSIAPTEKEMRAAEASEEQRRLELEVVEEELEELRQDYEILILAAEQVFDGSKVEAALASSRQLFEDKKNFMNTRELAGELFKFTPEFELFEDFSSLLPNRIDLEDIVLMNPAAEGYKAAINFLTITGLDYSFFQQPSSRILKQKIENLNGELTLNFQDFWRQNVGKNNKIKINFELAHYDHSHEEKSGMPFIEFWIKDESERLYPKQRSRGVRWFLSFFLELKATAMDNNRKNKLLLIDEPGVSLHARAQEDVLKVFDDIKDQMQIIYSTHSPHLIDVNKLYRVIAVQRAVEDDMNSETVLLNARSLKTATADTLSPVYAMMGARLSQQDIIKSFNNVVVKDLATFYFLKAIHMLTGYNKKECFFIPASGTSSMPMIINILIGWGLEYVALNFSNDEEKFMYNKLRKELFENNVDLANNQLLFMRDFPDTEDLFSTIDFKKHIIHVREGITINNSEYLKDNNHSRAVLASNFLQSVSRKEIKFTDLDDESRHNLNMLMDKIDKLLK